MSCNNTNGLVNIYHPKVKVSGWQEDGSLPRDNDPYNVCKKNYFLSTHNRFGSDNSGFPISTTREMQQQILSKSTILRRCAPQRALRDQAGFKESCKYIMREGTGVHPMDYFITDYTTSNIYEYRHPNPQLAKPLEPDLSPPPPTYRKAILCGESINSKFWDDNLCRAVKCYPDHMKPPPYVNLDLYYGNETNHPKQQKIDCKCSMDPNEALDNCPEKGTDDKQNDPENCQCTEDSKPIECVEIPKDTHIG